MRKNTTFTVLDVLRDLMLGGRHSRRTVAKLGVSLPTADRWLQSLRTLPGIRVSRVGKITWFAFVWIATRPRAPRRAAPPRMRVSPD